MLWRTHYLTGAIIIEAIREIIGSVKQNWELFGKLFKRLLEMDFILTAQTRIQLLVNYYINYRIASDGSAGLCVWLTGPRVPGQPSNFTFNIWWLLPRHSLPSFTFCLLVLYLLFSLSLFLLYFYIYIGSYLLLEDY